MSRSPRTVRVAHLEAQQHSATMADLLRRVRACPTAEAKRELFSATLPLLDPRTQEAIWAQLTDAEEAEVIGPEAARLMDTLSEAELGAIAQGDPATIRRLQRAAGTPIKTWPVGAGCRPSLRLLCSHSAISWPLRDPETRQSRTGSPSLRPRTETCD